MPDEVNGQTRYEALRRTLDDASDILAELNERFDVKVYAFDRNVRPLEVAEGRVALPESPEGNETAIGQSLETVLRDDEVLAAVLVPTLPSAFGAAYARFGLRNGNAVAVASVAAGLALDSDNTVRDARIVLGAVAPIPKLAESAGAGLIGQSADEGALRSAANAAREAAEPISDVRGSADYRRELVAVLAYRALIEALQRAKETQ